MTQQEIKEKYLSDLREALEEDRDEIEGVSYLEEALSEPEWLSENYFRIN
jgi:hypothetical protein